MMAAPPTITPTRMQINSDMSSAPAPIYCGVINRRRGRERHKKPMSAEGEDPAAFVKGGREASHGWWWW